MITRKTFYTITLTVVGIVVLANILSWFFWVRFDFTADGSYTLSDATRQTLKELKQPVTVTAYISPDLPPDISKTRDDLRDILTEYASLAGSNFIFKMEDPGDGAKAEADGITPAILDVRDKDQVKQQKIYLGAIVRYGSQKEVIPLIQPGTSMEYSLTTAVKKMSSSKKSSVGYLQGHGEPSMQAVAQLMQTLSVTLDVLPVDLSDSLFIPEQIKTLLIVAPSDSIPAPHLEVIDRFLKKGGRIVAAVNRVTLNQQTGDVKELRTGLEDFLREKGISVKPDLVRDYSCAQIMVQQQSAGMVFQTPVRVPNFPIITTFAGIPPLKGLEAITLMFPSSIDTVQGRGFRFVPLAATSDRAGLDVLPYKVDLNREWEAADFQLANILVAVLAEEQRGKEGAKIAVISDGDFVVNGEGEGAQSIQEDNVNFVANLVEYFTDDSGIAGLRNKTVTSRPIDPSIGEGARTVIKYLNFLMPAVLSVLFGLWRYSKRKAMRQALASESWSGEEKEEGGEGE